MPLYEYQCTKCGVIEEVIQKFSDPPLTTCPHCSGKMDKLISQSSFHLKGTGWYVTDYSKKAPPAADSKRAEAAPPGGEKNNSSGTESKAPKNDN